MVRDQYYGFIDWPIFRIDFRQYLELSGRRPMDRYAESQNIRPVMLGIASLIPGVSGVGAGVDSWVIAHVERKKAERLEYLIECLESGVEDFGGPILIHRSEPAIHAAYATIEATLRTSRREKIRAYARLLQSGLENPPQLDLESEHEDFLKILDDLSLRELQLLWLLDRFEEDNPRQADETDSQWTDRHWRVFEDAAQSQLSMRVEELSGLLMRLARTGMYEPIYIAAYGGEVFTTGKLTGAYKRLAELLGNDTRLFDTGQIVY